MGRVAAELATYKHGISTLLDGANLALDAGVRVVAGALARDVRAVVAHAFTRRPELERHGRVHRGQRVG